MSDEKSRHDDYPQGWAKDVLSDFQNIAAFNERATFVHASDWHATLNNLAVDLKCCSDHVMKNFFKVDDPTSFLLFLNAHNQFLAAARVWASGQVLATYPLCRAATESALYGWYLANEPDAAQRWHDKPEDHAKLREWNKEFKFSALVKRLSDKSKDCGEWAAYLHQTAIDFGAHPNKHALYSNMEIKDIKDGGRHILVKFLHEIDGSAIGAAKHVVETGIFLVNLFSDSFGEAKQIYSLSTSIDARVMELNKLVEKYGPVAKGARIFKC